jgi:hypothetical protein
MTMPGTAILALWNDCNPTREDYSLWHTREHVPQRLSMPGFIRAYRYCDGDGSLPKYFTVYALVNLDPLETEDYRHLLANPTRWSASMRPDIERYLRLPCSVRVSSGVGIGGFALVYLVKLAGHDAIEAGSFARLTELPAITAVRYAAVDRDSPAIPFTIAKEQREAPDGVLIIEGYDVEMLRAARSLIDTLLNRGITLSDATVYKLAYVMNSDEWENARPFIWMSSPPGRW